MKSNTSDMTQLHTGSGKLATETKKSTASVSLRGSEGAKRSVVQSSRSNEGGRRGATETSTSKSQQLQNTTTSKNLNTAASSTANSKKSVELRTAVKESHKKPSFVDKDRGSGGRIGDKKEAVTKPNAARKQSTTDNKKTSVTPAKIKSGTNRNTDSPDNIQTTVRQTSKPDKKDDGTKSGSSTAKEARKVPGAKPRSIEKAGSSVSLVRKKFESKIESVGEGCEQAAADKKSSQRMPNVKISQNLFLKGDANAKKKSENEVDMSTNGGYSSQSNKGHSKHNATNSLEESESLDLAESSKTLQALSPSDNSPVPSPETEPIVDLKHSSDSSSSIHSQPIIHPDCHVNEFETDTRSQDTDRGSPVIVVQEPHNLEDEVFAGEAGDEAEAGGQRLAPAHLETELPESPAYRSPLLSDSEPETDSASSRHHVLEAFVGSSDEPSLRNKLLTNLVNKRSESDGIVCLDRPRPELQVRRCESVDNAIDLVDRDSVERIPEPPTVHFPQGIKTVTPATIMKGPEDYAGGQDETVYLKTHYFGNPEPRVFWFKNGREVCQSERVKIRTYPGESTLVIKDLRADDSGKYEIQIENEVGSDSCSASLCCEGPPEPPGGRPYITSIDRDALRLTLAWYGSTFDGGSMLTGYIIEMSSWPIIADSRDQPEPTDWTIVTSKCHSTSYKVKNLDPEREYIFRIEAQNIHGPSAPGKVSEPVSFMKFEDEDDEPDEDDASEDEDSFYNPFNHRVVSLEEGSIFKDNFDIYEELGRGRFGVVFKVHDKVTREVFAAKFVRCRKQEEREKCKEEINIMNGLDHSRLLQLAAAYETPREVIMIMEFIGGGELFEKVVADDFTLTEHDCVLFMRQICQAIGYMHTKDIVHLDLKPENILCKSKKSHQIKIIDFGLTRKLKPGEDVRILFGTPEFVSPEVISYEPVSAASDMWSVGVVCYVLLSGLSPFMGESDVETFANITGLNYDFDDEAFEHISEDAKDFIHKMLVKDQRRRLKALECLKHPWLDHRDTAKRSRKEINTDKLKSFLMRRRWQKAAHAIRALGRFTSLGFRHDHKDGASSIALSTQSADF